MKIKAKIKNTGEVKVLKSYGFSYIDATGTRYSKKQIKFIGVFDE